MRIRPFDDASPPLINGRKCLGTAGAPPKRLFELMTALELAMYIGLFGLEAVPRDLSGRDRRMIDALHLLNRERIAPHRGGQI